ncbi:hypothetical protein N9948_01215 [bacterium]|nr:hypothetical protein [bacterium]
MTKKAKNRLQPNKVKIEKKREKLRKTLKQAEKKILNPTPDYKKQLKPKKIKTNKLTDNPLFIRFLNWQGDKHSIDLFLDRIIFSFESEEDKEIVSRKKEDITDVYLDNLSAFQQALKKNVLETIKGKDISEFFLTWLNNAFNYLDETVEEYINDEIRTISIKDPEGKWFEGVICYNFIMTFNYFGVDILKNCPVCKSFFCHKGPYARYCSDSCKDRGKK